MMRVMLGCKRRSGEEGDDYHYRVNLQLKRIRTRFQIMTWDMMIKRMQFRFLGHIHRFSMYDVERLALLVLNWRGVGWLKELEGRRGGQMHGRRFKMWRYEWQVSHQFPNHEWKAVAEDRVSWEECLDVKVVRKRWRE